MNAYDAATSGSAASGDSGAGREGVRIAARPYFTLAVETARQKFVPLIRQGLRAAGGMHI
jgi:hypothetical protein